MDFPTSAYALVDELMNFDDVFDVMYFGDLGRYKRRITPFITWEPLPILKPRG
jgi:hypothetical protein